jgi:hypothetical protein
MINTSEHPRPRGISPERVPFPGTGIRLREQVSKFPFLDPTGRSGRCAHTWAGRQCNSLMFAFHNHKPGTVTQQVVRLNNEIFVLHRKIQMRRTCCAEGPWARISRSGLRMTMRFFGSQIPCPSARVQSA